MKNSDSMKSIDSLAWTSEHLDGCNVEIRRTRKLADGCYMVEQIYRSDK